MLNPKHKRLLLILAGAIALLSVLSATGILRISPLSKAELKFVGEWKHFLLSEEYQFSNLTFHENRTFETADGQLRGRWWIDEGKLQMKTWDRDGAKFIFNDLWQEWNAEIECWSFADNDSGDQITISPSDVAAVPENRLIRAN